MVRLPDRALVGSVALHGVLLIAAAANVDWRRQPPAAPAVSIKATVVDMSVFDEPVPLTPAAVAPVDDGAREQERQREEQAREADRARQAREVQEALEAQQRAEEQAAQRERQAEDERREREADAEAERKRSADAEAQRKRQADAAERKRQADEEAERQRKAAEEAARKLEAEEAERKRKAEAEAEARRKQEAEEAERKRKAEQRAARERREREAQLMAQAERENLMREQMELETQRQTAVDSGQLAQYIALVQQHIKRNWIRPPSAREGLECRVSVQQIPGGEVVSVRILTCNGDQAVERSIEAAIRKASPLPVPTDSTLFQRDLEILFVPN